jgi:hypothetical protein
MMTDVQLPEPKPGMVIHYEYLWARQHDKGWKRAEKIRPCVILAVVEGKRDKTVYVSPLTHTAPYHPEESILLTQETKQRVGLDGNDSWLMCNEVNKFTWPSALIRTVPYSSPRTFVYGMLPECVLTEARCKLKEFTEQCGLHFVPRPDNAPHIWPRHSRSRSPAFGRN